MIKNLLMVFTFLLLSCGCSKKNKIDGESKSSLCVICEKKPFYSDGKWL